MFIVYHHDLRNLHFLLSLPFFFSSFGSSQLVGMCVYVYMSVSRGRKGGGILEIAAMWKFPIPNPASCLFPTPAKGHQNFPEEEDLGDIQLPSVLSPGGNAHAALPEFM
jgi:hypothetical protein